ncbi:MAG: hypothetical protein QW727_03215 [Candidatus Pacearchaeota archaeon]
MISILMFILLFTLSLFILEYQKIKLSPIKTDKCSFIQIISGNCPVFGQLDKSPCNVEFNGLEINLESITGKKISGFNECQKLSLKEDKINEVVCLNSKGLGEIKIKWIGEEVHSFPIECSENLAENTEITLDGEIKSAIVEDFDSGKYYMKHFIEDKRGRFFEIHSKEFISNEINPNFPPGTFVKIRAKLERNKVFVSELSNIEKSELFFSPISGEKKILAIITNFNDTSVSCSPNQINQLIFTGRNSTKDYYSEVSFGKINLSGNVIGPYNINFSSLGSCDSSTYNLIKSLADSAAQNSGFDLNQYNHIIYITPPSCNGGGSLAWAELGGRRIFNLGKCGSKGTYIHELGHNYGMHHASSTKEQDIFNVGLEYGDVSDVMGNHFTGGIIHVNSPHKFQMGWIPSDKFILNPVSGIYTIYASEINPSANYSLHGIIFSYEKDNYYLSYRKPLGFSSAIKPYYVNVTNIHIYNGGMTKTNFTYKIKDGETFVSPDGFFNVTQVSHNEDSVTINLSVSDICQIFTPSISLTPNSQIGSPGDSLSYTFTIKNNDISCPPSSFSLTSIKPIGWNASLTQESLNLNPGEIGSAILLITSKTDVVEGNYNVGVRTERRGFIADSYSSYIIDIIDTTPPSAPKNLQVSLQKNSNIKLSWQSSTDNVAVKGYKIFRNNLEIAFTTSTSYTDITDLSQSQTYYVIAVDTSNNPSDKSNEATISPDSLSGGSTNIGRKKR